MSDARRSLEAMVRQARWLFYAGVVATLAAMPACSGPDEAVNDAAAAAPVSEAPASTVPESTAPPTPEPSVTAKPTAMKATIAEPRPDHVLQIGVKSATRAGEQIELVLSGTYGGTKTTQWNQTSVEAGTDTGTCQVTPDPGFPGGSSRPRSVVTGTWVLTCPGEGPVRLAIDPFSGLLDSDTSFRITLR
ncbi:hypothetical protein [Paractinoplanes lichenicola]|uniref:Uncharacterized protein n=1 Tax=Paractinoplanes lichenicola TaxID=2802976 RepID=A0ABS1VWA7_9ACTN|nr:hypothetical protein [Actinoplanes lichenicola]MBL7258771.1 hypothetical protein [Actinoplanes lichenicola]